MRKLLWFLILAISVSTFSVVTEASQPITITVNGWELVSDIPPVLEKGRVLVPVRQISEDLGAKVDWDATTGTITIIDVNNELKLVVDSTTAYQNGREVKLEVPATLKNSRTLVPIRFISEALGAKVENKIVQRTTVHYYGRFEQNTKFCREFIVMTDGKNAFVVNDHTGEIEKTYDLVALGGEDDNYFIEGIGQDFLLIRPNRKGVLSLVYPATGEKVL